MFFRPLGAKIYARAERRKYFRTIKRSIYERNPVELDVRSRVQKRFEMPRDKERKEENKRKKLRLNYIRWVVQLAATQYDNTEYITKLKTFKDHEVSKCVQKLKMPPDEKEAKFAGTPWGQSKAGSSFSGFMGVGGGAGAGGAKPGTPATALKGGLKKGGLKKSAEAGAGKTNFGLVEVKEVDAGQDVHGETASEILENQKIA